MVHNHIFHSSSCTDRAQQNWVFIKVDSEKIWSDSLLPTPIITAVVLNPGTGILRLAINYRQFVVCSFATQATNNYLNVHLW